MRISLYTDMLINMYVVSRVYVCTHVSTCVNLQGGGWAGLPEKGRAGQEKGVQLATQPWVLGIQQSQPNPLYSSGLHLAKCPALGTHCTQC